MMSLAWSPPRVREAWRLPFLLVSGLLLLILLVHRETGATMVGIWMRSETFTHSFVVPPIVAWLIWGKRGELVPIQSRPSALALLLMLAAVALWWLGYMAHVAAAMHFALVAMLVASVPLVLGWAVCRTLAFPLAFAFFTVPFGEFLTPTLMHWTAEALVTSLRLTGIPVYQEGQQLMIPSGRWAVVEACGGIRYLMATFMVGSLFAYLNYQRLGKRLAFVAVSLVLPVLANWVRAYIIVMLGHLSGNQIATGVDHLVYGWVFFGIVILALFFIGARWADVDDPAQSTGLAEQRDGPSAGQSSSLLRVLSLAAAGLFIVVAPTLRHTPMAAAAAAAPIALALPATMGAWRATPLSDASWQPQFPAARLRLATDYKGPTGTVGVHVAYYRGQHADAKLVSSVNGFTGSKLWHVLSDTSTITMVNGQSIGWRQAVLTTGDGRMDTAKPQLTVWRLYWLGGPLAHDDARAKLIQAWQAMSGTPDDGAAIHLVSSLPDPAAARRQLEAFANDNFAMLAGTLGAARESR